MKYAYRTKMAPVNNAFDTHQLVLDNLREFLKHYLYIFGK